MVNQGNLTMEKQKLYLSAWGLWNILSPAAQQKLGYYWTRRSTVTARTHNPVQKQHESDSLQCKHHRTEVTVGTGEDEALP